jgi:hypothetical protein
MAIEPTPQTAWIMLLVLMFATGFVLAVYGR